MSSISLVGIGANWVLPGTFLQVVMPAGTSAGQVSAKNVLLMGNKLATAPMIEDGYVYGPDVSGFVIANEADCIAQAGQGSELHVMYREFVRLNGQVPVYLLAVKESTGVAASRNITFSGTATANGSVRTFVAKEFVDTAVAKGDGYVAVATAVASSINSQLNWWATASANNGVVTVTCKNKGPRGNWLRLSSVVQGVIGISSDTTVPVLMTGGTVEDGYSVNGNWVNALATILPQHFTYIVTPAEDSTPSSGNASKLAAQVDIQALPATGNRQRVVFAQTDTLGNASAWAKQLNDPLCEVPWQPSCNATPGQLAAICAAGYVNLENQTVPEVNFDGMGVTPVTRGFMPVPAPFDGSSPTKSDMNAALLAGLSPVGVNGSKQCFLAMRVTSYSHDPIQTSIADARTRDGCIPTVMFNLADVIESKLSQSFSQKKIAADPPSNGRPPGPSVATPSIIKGSVNKVLQDFADNDLLQNVATSKALTVVAIESSPAGRVSVQVDAQVAQPLHQFAVLLNQVSQLV